MHEIKDVKKKTANKNTTGGSTVPRSVRTIETNLATCVDSMAAPRPYDAAMPIATQRHEVASARVSRSEMSKAGRMKIMIRQARETQQRAS
eukprot:3627613-Pleurochrysis_carterae.AAC.2